MIKTSSDGLPLRKLFFMFFYTIYDPLFWKNLNLNKLCYQHLHKEKVQIMLLFGHLSYKYGLLSFLWLRLITCPLSFAETLL